MESFNGRLRDECLNETLFVSLTQARAVLDAWRTDYNGVRPHSALASSEPITWPLPQEPETVKTLAQDSPHDWKEVGAQVNDGKQTTDSVAAATPLRQRFPHGDAAMLTAIFSNGQCQLSPGKLSVLMLC